MCPFQCVDLMCYLAQVFRRDEITRHYQDVHDSMEARRAQQSECVWKEAADCQQRELRLVPFNKDWTVHKCPDGVEVVAPVSSIQGLSEDKVDECVADDGEIFLEQESVEHPALHRGLSKEEELSFYGYESHEIVGDTSESGVRVPRQLSQADELAMYGYESDASELHADKFHLCSPLLDIPVEVWECFSHNTF